MNKIGRTVAFIDPWNIFIWVKGCHGLFSKDMPFETKIKCLILYLWMRSFVKRRLFVCRRPFTYRCRFTARLTPRSYHWASPKSLDAQDLASRRKTSLMDSFHFSHALATRGLQGTPPTLTATANFQGTPTLTTTASFVVRMRMISTFSLILTSLEQSSGLVY